MEDQFEKKLKTLLPYIIITAVVYLLLPLFMSGKETAATYIILIGAFPLTAVGCGAHCAIVKKQRELLVCVIAPAFYALTALLYGMWHDSALTVLLYLAAYLICGYLGLLLGELLSSSGKESDSRPVKRTSPRPRRVNVTREEAPVEQPITEDPAQDSSLDAATTEDDIEAILDQIHSRRSQ